MSVWVVQNRFGVIQCVLSSEDVWDAVCREYAERYRALGFTIRQSDTELLCTKGTERRWYGVSEWQVCNSTQEL